MFIFEKKKKEKMRKRIQNYNISRRQQAFQLD